jgi:hypothetical protein
MNKLRTIVGWCVMLLFVWVLPAQAGGFGQQQGAADELADTAKLAQGEPEPCAAACGPTCRGEAPHGAMRRMLQGRCAACFAACQSGEDNADEGGGEEEVEDNNKTYECPSSTRLVPSGLCSGTGKWIHSDAITPGATCDAHTGESSTPTGLCCCSSATQRNRQDRVDTTLKFSSCDGRVYDLFSEPVRDLVCAPILSFVRKYSRTVCILRTGVGPGEAPADRSVRRLHNVAGTAVQVLPPVPQSNLRWGGGAGVGGTEPGVQAFGRTEQLPDQRAHG